MANGTVVSRSEIRVNEEPFMRLIRYYAKAKQFQIELPQSVALALDMPVVSAETQDEVIVAFDEACKKARQQKTTKRKVIIVTYLARAKIGDEWIPPQKDQRSYSWNTPDPNESKLELQYEVGEEHTFGDRKEYIVNGNKTSLYGDDHRILEWTPDAEQFFDDVVKRFRLMIKSVHLFMTQKQPEMVKAIARHGGMLELPAPKKG